MADWFQLLAAALGGGVTVKVLDIVYQEFRHRSDDARSAARFVNEHLDPVLKAADEIVGKLRALAESDFTELHNLETDPHRLESTDLSGVLYLFGRFWARIEILRREGISIAMGQDERGKQLQSFLDCLESRRVRIVDRISQRAAGEVLIEKGAPPDTVSFVDFVEAFESEESVRRWLRPLVAILTRVRHTYDRQRLLQYGVVIHALIDTLDPEHLVTHERPSYPNKLTKRSWRDLRYRVFGRYLSFVPDSGKYLGPPKRNRAVK